MNTKGTSLNRSQNHTRIGWVAALAVVVMAMVGYAAAADATEWPQEGVKYKIQARHSNLFLDVLGEAQAVGANVGQWESDDLPNQQWTFHHISDNLYKIKAVHSGRYLDVLGQGIHNGDNVAQWQDTGLKNQEWRLVEIENGYFRIQNEHSKLYLDVLGQRIHNGDNVGQWEDNPGYQQQWKLVALDSGGRATVNVGKSDGFWRSGCSGGQGCTAEIEQGISMGTETQKSWNSELKTTVSASVEASAGVEGVASTKSTVTASLEATVGQAKAIVKNKASDFKEKCSTTIDMKEYKIHTVWQWVIETPVGSEMVTVKTCTITCTPDAVKPDYLPGSVKDIDSCLKKRV